MSADNLWRRNTLAEGLTLQLWGASKAESFLTDLVGTRKLTGSTVSLYEQLSLFFKNTNE
jgi:hypothetical protein